MSNYTPAERELIEAAQQLAADTGVSAGCVPMPGKPARFVVFGELSQIAHLVRGAEYAGVPIGADTGLPLYRPAQEQARPIDSAADARDAVLRIKEMLGPALPICYQGMNFSVYRDSDVYEAVRKFAAVQAKGA